jgi:hypothetical protein
MPTLKEIFLFIAGAAAFYGSIFLLLVLGSLIGA